MCIVQNNCTFKGVHMSGSELTKSDCTFQYNFLFGINILMNIISSLKYKKGQIFCMQIFIHLDIPKCNEYLSFMDKLIQKYLIT